MTLKPILFSILFFFAYKSTYAQKSDEDRKANFPKTREVVKTPPKKDKVWVFIMAGQSNMAGRGFVEPMDTLSNERILSINSDGELVYAKEPFHWYEPNLTGLDCGMSFAQTLLKDLPQDVSILMLPVAIGGSSMSQWLGDSTYRGVPLFTNFKEKVSLGDFYGEIKGIIWHQGESDANERNIAKYPEHIKILFNSFRYVIENEQLPILMGELGSYSKTNENWQRINNAFHDFTDTEPHTYLINTQDLKHKGDYIHFNSEGQREIGKRFAKAFSDIED
jgi:hypothetical protein